jgi:hypothetical protein
MTSEKKAFRPVPILIDPDDDEWTIVVNGLRRYKVKPEGKSWQVVDLRRGGSAMSALEERLFHTAADATTYVVDTIMRGADDHV